jgi:tripartite-type tricarboxylate transporter receptor subunit TctC
MSVRFKLRGLSAVPRRMTASACVLLLLSFPAIAQTWPSGPITVLMGFTAGSGIDVIMRTVQEPMQQALGVPLVKHDLDSRLRGNDRSLRR